MFANPVMYKNLVEFDCQLPKLFSNFRNDGNVVIATHTRSKALLLG